MPASYRSETRSMARRRPSLQCMTGTVVRLVPSLGDATDVSVTLCERGSRVSAGSTVAKFAGDTVHHRLAANDFFKKRDWEASLKRAFLETDEDLRASASLPRVAGRAAQPLFAS